jgi:5'-3' exonuclease
MQVHLVDGTYELFRYFFAMPEHVNADGEQVGAVRGVVGSVLNLIEQGATHVGVATDHVIPSFRNELWDGYKDGSEIDPLIEQQFGLLEDALVSAGFTVWPMVEVEADDALAAAAAIAAADERVERAIICTPDKDLAQCVRADGRVVQLDRRKETLYDWPAVIEKFGVSPTSIPDYLGLVGDTADGFPGLPGWGAKSAALVLAEYEHIEAIPHDVTEWAVKVRGGAKLAQTLHDNFDDALLFRRIATVETELDVGAVDEWCWTGPTAAFGAMCDRLDAPALVRRADSLVG